MSVQHPSNIPKPHCIAEDLSSKYRMVFEQLVQMELMGKFWKVDCNKQRLQLAHSSSILFEDKLPELLLCFRNQYGLVQWVELQNKLKVVQQQ